MKKFILFFFALVASVCAFAQGTADFNTLEPSSSYKTFTTTAGWVIENGCVHGGASDPDNASNPHFALFGDSDGAVAAVINGKTTAVGTITSPVLEGGCGTLSLNYAYMFKETSGVSFHIAIVQNGATAAEYDVVDTELAQSTAGFWSEKVAVPGDFQIVITNNCPSNSTSNKDRYSIWNLSWTAQAPLPVNPVVASITAVFPNGNKHVVYSNGEKLTAGAEVPADAIAQFDVVSRTENTIVLKAGDQYIHWTSGDDKNKSSDLDGLNEEFDETLNTLSLAPATLQGCSTSATWGKTEEDVQGLYRLQGMGTNGQLFDFTLREYDDAWIAGNSGNIFFDTNWDGNGCRTSFFEIVFEEEAAAVEPVLSADDVHAKHSYYIYTDARGGLTIMDENATNLVGTSEAGVGQEVDATNPLQQFAFVNYEGDLYLYSVGAGKFVNAAAKGILEDTPKTPILFKEAGEDDVMLYFDAKHNFNLGGSKQVTIDGWDDKDAGNSFHIMLADSFDPAPVLAALEASKEGSADVTYNYTIGGKVWKTVVSEQKKGEPVAAPAEQAFVNIVSYDEVNVTDGVVVNVVCEEALPFTVTTNTNRAYGYLRGHSNQIRYAYVNEEGLGMDERVEEEKTEFADNYLWYITGNLIDGFELHNKAYGVLRATEGQTSVNGDANSVWQLRQGRVGSTLTENIFALWAEGVTYINCQGGLKYWDDNDNGSTFTFTVVENEELTPEGPVYYTAAQVREKAATGRFAILGITSTGDHYINGEAGTGHVSADGTLAGVRDPEGNEIVYLVQNGEQYNIQRECDGKFFQVNAGADIVLVDEAADATPFFVYGKDDAAYGPVSGYADLFSDIEATTNDLMVRFVANNQWLNTQGANAIGGLRGGTGAWSFQYVRYMGEKEVVTPEPTAVTFEFTDNEDGTITITPSDLKALYFFNIYSDRINTEYQQGTDAEAIAGDVAQNLTAPEYEVHTGVSVVDPAEWLEYWFGGYVKYTEGDYRLGVVELAYDGTYSMGGEPVFHAFTKAAPVEPVVKSNEFVTDGKVYTLTAITKAGEEYAWTVQNGEVVPVLNGTPAKFVCEFHGDDVAFVTEDGKYLRNHDCDPSTATWYTDKSATGIDNEYSELCNLVFEHFPATAANVDAGYGDVTADLVAIKAARGHRTDNGLIAEGYFIMNSNGTFSGAATTAPFFKDGYTSAFRLVEYVEEVPETFPMEGVAYKFKNVDSQLYVKVIDDAEQCVTLGQTPDEMFFTAVEGGWAISTSKGYVLGATAKGWNIGNTATPIVWTIEEVEGGYAFKNEKGYLGYDTAAAGQKAFRDKNYSTHHGIFNIWKYDEEEIIVVPDKTLEETWENIHNLLAEAEAIKELNEVTLTYDRDGYFEDFTSPIVGKVGYKKHDDVWAVCDGADYVNDFVSYFESAAEADAYLADFGGIAALEEIITNVIDDYNAAEVVLPTPGKTYVIRNYPYTYSDEYSYAYYYNGSKLALAESANATTAEYMWTVSEPVNYSYFDADLNVISETRYQFVNAADETKFMSWRGAGTDNYAGVTTNAADANSKWYLTGKKVDGSATPAYGTLALRTNADGNQYRTAVVDMRKSTDHLSKSNGDHFDATYSSWFIFEEVEIPVTEWDGNEPIVEVKDATTVKVTFTDAHSVEASHFGVLGAIFDEQGDVTAIVFNDLFGDTVEFGKDCATLHFKKISEINAELAEAAKGMASKVTAAANGDTKGKVVICSKSFKIDGDYIYNETIVRDFEIAGNITGIDAIATDANTKVFDLQGRRVVLPAKGVFVKDGRKVVK